MLRGFRCCDKVAIKQWSLHLLERLWALGERR